VLAALLLRPAQSAAENTVIACSWSLRPLAKPDNSILQESGPSSIAKSGNRISYSSPVSYEPYRYQMDHRIWTVLAVLVYLGPKLLEDLKDHWRK
jgi:hypothetical protein